ncbi:peptidoglycan bridge formation glycyltransferase FemA/FemB family protein [Candidatus Woesearchaeota archaeon]|nr:peptidoglycan bridge formation glycyltransferase FemA/FemB family protein [Candidatus Woesearchaeota archaeon]
MPFIIESLNANNVHDWQEFVAEQKHATVFHSLEWKEIIEKTFAHIPEYLMAREKETRKVVALFPAFLVKSFIFKNRIISLPFSDYGGICFASQLNQEEKEKIMPQILSLLDSTAKKNNCSAIEIRGQQMNDPLSKGVLQHNNFIHTAPYVTFIIPLQEKKEISLRSPSVQRIVKKNVSRLLLKEVEEKEMKTFYNLYLQTMRRFCSPPYPKKFFALQKKILGEHYHILGAYYNERLISALVFVCWKKTVYYLYGVSDPKYNSLSPHYSIHDAMITYAKNKGMETFDLCRTRKNSGVYIYKKKWGGEEKEVDYLFKIYKKVDLNLDPENRKFYVAQKIISIFPLEALRIIGPPLRKHIGK